MRTLLVLLCFVFPFEVAAQEGIIHGGEDYDSGYRVDVTRDSGFIVAGWTNSKGAGNRDYWAVRFDKYGRIVFDSAYGTARYELLWSVQSTRDNGALLAGFSGVQFSGTERALMYKIDSLGRQVRKIDVNYARADHAHTMHERPEGGYYFAGHTDSEGDVTGDMWVQKLDANFAVVWDSTYDRRTGEHAHDADLTADGGMIILGHTAINNYEKFWTIRVDSNGKSLWSKTYSSSAQKHDSPYEIKVTREGNFMMVGGSGDAVGSKVWLLVVDSNGTPVINKHFGDGESFGWSGIQTADGGYLVSGYTNFDAAGRYDMYVIKTDASGELQWEKRLGTDGDEFAYDVVELQNKFVVIGSTDYNGSDDLWVAVIDQQGEYTSLESPANVSGSPIDVPRVQVFPSVLRGSGTPVTILGVPSGEPLRVQLHNTVGVVVASVDAVANSQGTVELPRSVFEGMAAGSYEVVVLHADEVIGMQRIAVLNVR